jgi:hypothetical protein
VTGRAGSGTLPAFASTIVNFTPQADFVRVNATYK